MGEDTSAMSDMVFRAIQAITKSCSPLRKEGMTTADMVAALEITKGMLLTEQHLQALKQLGENPDMGRDILNEIIEDEKKEQRDGWWS